VEYSIIAHSNLLRGVKIKKKWYQSVLNKVITKIGRFYADVVNDDYRAANNIPCNFLAVKWLTVNPCVHLCFATLYVYLRGYVLSLFFALTLIW